MEFMNGRSDFDFGGITPSSPTLSEVIISNEPNVLKLSDDYWISDDYKTPFEPEWEKLNRCDPSIDSSAKQRALDGVLLYYMAPNRPDIAIETARVGIPNLPKKGKINKDYNLKVTDRSPVTSFISATDNTPEISPHNKTVAVKKCIRGKTRLGVSLTLELPSGNSAILACAATGSEENIISAELGQALGIQSTEYVGNKKQFVLGNGKTIESMGHVTIRCSFGAKHIDDAPAKSFVFNVFQKLAAPIIVGLKFLEQTETLTKYTKRLIKIPRPGLQALQVFSIGRARRDLICYVDEIHSIAVPDSGSDIDLMAPRFILERELPVFPGEELIEFADGSIAITSGYVQADLALSDVERPGIISRTSSISNLEFYLLDGLALDILIGLDTLEELKICTQRQDCLVSCTPSINSTSTSSTNVFNIGHHGTVSRVISWVKRKIALIQGREGQIGYSVEELSSDTNIIDQQENDRRERVALRIATLPLDQRESAIEAESQRQSDFDNRAKPSEASNDRPSGPRLATTDIPQQSVSTHLTYPTPDYGLFKCQHDGCIAPPFQTQYLLISHASIHYQRRTFYCPVLGCTRAAGGRGFRRENEMIRHELIHYSPEYVCPFCPGSEHRYPRPDDLKRHMRAHFPGTAEDDTQLQESYQRRHEDGRRTRRRLLDVPC